MKKIRLHPQISVLLVCLTVLLVVANVSTFAQSSSEYTYTEKLITASRGGTIEIAKRCTINVPADALDSDTVLTIEAFTTDDTIGSYKIDMIFNFGPSPLTFNENVKMVFPWDDYCEGDTDTVFLFYYDEVNQTWQRQNSAVVVNIPGNRLVLFNVDHFSRYALAGPSQPAN